MLAITGNNIAPEVREKGALKRTELNFNARGYFSTDFTEAIEKRKAPRVNLACRNHLPNPTSLWSPILG